MKYLFSLLFVAFALVGCQSDSMNNKGVRYEIHRQSNGVKPTVDSSFITIRMRTAKARNDSTIFSSYERDNPLPYKFSKSLFKGLFNEGISKMSPGDSATFWVIANSIYNQKLPNYIKPSDTLKYTISLVSVQSNADYYAQRKTEQGALLAEDKQKIDQYVQSKNLTLQSTPTGIQYRIEQAGTGESPKRGNKIKLRYTAQLLDGTAVDIPTPADAEVAFERQLRGLQEAVGLL